jgi:hypothetical protein
VRKKDTSLEKSLDLLEEGVRLANACTELIDHQDWVSASAPASGDEGAAEPTEASAPDAQSAESVEEETVVVEGVAIIDDVIIEDAEGNFVAEVIEVTEYEAVEEFQDADDAWADDSPAENPDEPDDPSAEER